MESIESNNNNQKARLATLSQLRETTLLAFIDPIPPDETLRNWFDKAGIPRFKANPTAKRGGGSVFYSVPHVEKYFRNRTLSPFSQEVA